METFADYILSEKDWIKKMEIIIPKGAETNEKIIKTTI